MSRLWPPWRRENVEPLPPPTLADPEFRAPAPYLRPKPIRIEWDPDREAPCWILPHMWRFPDGTWVNLVLIPELYHAYDAVKMMRRYLDLNGDVRGVLGFSDGAELPVEVVSEGQVYWTEPGWCFHFHRPIGWHSYNDWLAMRQSGIIGNS